MTVATITGGIGGGRWTPVTLPFKLVSVANQREHWSAKASRARTHRQGVWWGLVGAKQPIPTLPCVVTITRIGPRVMDTDNLASSCKALRDGIADWIGVDDGDSRIDWRYDQTKGKPNEYAVRIAIEAA